MSRLVRPTFPLGSCFVTGTGTDVGKTVVSAVLVQALKATYWKPIQSGLAEAAGDSATVAQLAGLSAERVVPPVYALRAALSPDQAAAAEGVRIDLAQIVPPSSLEVPLVVEGAGGVLVPISARQTMVHVMARLLLPVVVVAPSGLGTINHTVLTLEALRSRNLPVAGVILNGPPHPENQAAIERFGAVKVLGTVPPLAALTPTAVAEAGLGLDLSPLLSPPASGGVEF